MLLAACAQRRDGVCREQCPGGRVRVGEHDQANAGTHGGQERVDVELEPIVVADRTSSAANIRP